MSQTTSATTGRRYGLERVCRLWEQSRSAFYARRARLQRSASADSPCRRGPTPALSDAQLLAAIRNDLARSPFQGEGHRKVHARLRILDGVRVSRTQVLRVMRAQGLLSPHRGRQGEPKPHDGTIVTSAPDVMWGTDGARVVTVDDGWVWTFAAVDHWNAECVGWHVCKVGDRFAAPEPVAQGLRRRSGSVEADAARGLSLRMDHGSQYLSDHFLNQVRYWGIRPSFGLLKEPETNGVVCGRLRECKLFLSLFVLRSVLSPVPYLPARVLNEGQPSGWPAKVSRTVGRGCHPKGRSVAQDPRSGLTVVVDRARGGRAPSEGLRGSVHTVRCCRVSGLIDCGTSTAAGPYGDTRVGSKIVEVCSKARDASLVFPTPSHDRLPLPSSDLLACPTVPHRLLPSQAGRTGTR